MVPSPVASISCTWDRGQRERGEETSRPSPMPVPARPGSYTLNTKRKNGNISKRNTALWAGAPRGARFIFLRSDERNDESLAMPCQEERATMERYHTGAHSLVHPPRHLSGSRLPRGLGPATYACTKVQVSSALPRNSRRKKFRVFGISSTDW